MKRNYFLMLLALAFFLFSCRTENMTDEPVSVDTGNKFQLTSRRISLNESKHRQKLSPELSKAENFLKSLKPDVSGKTISYGNGISIDTDEVIYIENGPNYHTYTFHIKRENAPENAPLENLLLVPLPDGSYREFLITYHFTSSEKDRLREGLPVDTNGKTEIVKLANGTFNSGGQLARTVCNEVSETIWVECSQHVHNQSNVEDWVNCTAKVKPSVYTVVTMKCIEQNDDVITPIDPGTGSGGGGGGGTSGGSSGTNPPCTQTTIPTNPQPGFTDENGCPIGAPTQPNISAPFSIFVKSLPADLKDLLNNPANTEFYNGLSAYYYANNAADEAKSFITWAAQFKLENPDTTWEQFKNWFLNGYNTSSINKLPLLSSEELQEFININSEIDASLYDEEVVKETNEAFVAFTSYADVESMTGAQIENVLNQCCPSIIVVPQYMAQEKTKMIVATYRFNRKFWYC